MKKFFFFKCIQNFFYYLSKKPEAFVATGLILLLTLSIVVIITPIIPNNFEGSLVVSKLNFTYSGEEAKSLLYSISGIGKISGQGVQTLKLNGTFSTFEDDILNKKLKDNQYLTIQLYDQKSFWSIAPVDSTQRSEIELTELRIQPNTIIDSLSYEPYNQRLRLTLPLAQNSSKDFDLLRLNLDEHQVKIILRGYNIPELGLKDSPENSQREIIFQSNNPQLQLPIIKPTILSIDLPDLSKSDIDYEQWLRGDLVVKNVNFRELDDPGYDLGDRVEYSTILKGEIRMGERNIKVETNQFLLPRDIGIESLKSLAIKPSKENLEVELRVSGETVEISKPPEGIEVRIAGQAKRIQVGLDPRFPINSLQSNLPTKLGLSNEVVIAIVSFCLGVIISLFSWLSNDFRSWLLSSRSREFDGYKRSKNLHYGSSKKWFKK